MVVLLGSLGLLTSNILVTYTLELKFSLKVKTVPTVKLGSGVPSMTNTLPPYDLTT